MINGLVEATFRAWDYPQFLGLMVEALAGLKGPAVQVQELPFQFWGDLAEGANQVSATYDPPIDLPNGPGGKVSDILLYAPSAADPVSIYLRSAGVWYVYGTSLLQADRLERYVRTVRTRLDAEGG